MRRSSTGTETTYIYNKGRTGPYPARVQRRNKNITFNETFRALFPALLAVLLSLIVLTAFNQMGQNKFVNWIDETIISIPGYTKEQGFQSNTFSHPPFYRQKTYPFDPVKYEALGPLTSSSYWETKGRELEMKEKKFRPMLQSPPIGPETYRQYVERIKQQKK
ncbi:hypothetical protein CYY_007526 [Polysphondylium violaceum]|uniref:Transmembrane protein n=1 Tax=Polysphondylium violaceum TaxID=133409 RepID=A0A8J4PQP1_9MYCE|nr:hypothetical protein CYY_007526 [Polysphondylium violaceum]